MSHFVYIIQSEQDASYYIGSSHDPALRLEHHNGGWTRSTRGKRPWKLMYSEEHQTKSLALKREYHLKKMKSRAYIERLIHHAGGRPDAASVNHSV